MVQNNVKNWGKIDAAEAERVESVLANGEKADVGQSPLVNITVADGPEIRAAKESVEKVGCSMGTKQKTSADCRIALGWPGSTLGPCCDVTGLEGARPWGLALKNARSSRA